MHLKAKQCHSFAQEENIIEIVQQGNNEGITNTSLKKFFWFCESFVWKETLKANKGYLVVVCLCIVIIRIIVWIDFNRCKWIKAIRIRTNHIIIVQMFLSRDKRQMTNIVSFHTNESMQCKCIWNRHNRYYPASTTKFMTATQTYDEIHKTNWFMSSISCSFFSSFRFVHFCACRYTAVKWICLFVAWLFYLFIVAANYPQVLLIAYLLTLVNNVTH